MILLGPGVCGERNLGLAVARVEIEGGEGYGEEDEDEGVEREDDAVEVMADDDTALKWVGEVFGLGFEIGCEVVGQRVEVGDGMLLQFLAVHEGLSFEMIRVWSVLSTGVPLKTVMGHSCVGAGWLG